MSGDLARLRAFMKDGDAQTRGMAAVGLAKVSAPEADELLLELLADPDTRVICAAAQSLGERGERNGAKPAVVQALVQLMQRPEQDVVCSAIVALALIRPIQAFNPIVVALFDARDEVRRNAAAAIGRLGDVRALEPLHAILDDSYHWVRSNAALSLAALHQPASAPLLAQRMAVETDETVLSNLVMALLACDPASQPAALQLMADPNAGDKPRIAACLGLVEAAQRGDLQQEAGERFAAQLLESLADASCPDELRASCAWALGRMPATPAARAALEAAQNDPYQWVRDYASESLALLASD